MNDFEIEEVQDSPDTEEVSPPAEERLPFSFDDQEISRGVASDGMGRVTGMIRLNNVPDSIPDDILLQNALKYLGKKYKIDFDNDTLNNPYRVLTYDGSGIFYNLPFSESSNIVTKSNTIVKIALTQKQRKSKEKEDKVINSFFRFFEENDHNVCAANKEIENLIEKVAHLSPVEKQAVVRRVKHRLAKEYDVYLDYFRNMERNVA